MTAPHGKPPTPDRTAARGPILVLRDRDQKTVGALVLLAVAFIAIPYWQGRDSIRDIGSLGHP